MSYGALITVRLESKRFPQKALQKINNQSILEIIITRLKKVENKKNIVICTYKSKKNYLLKKIAKKHNIEIFFGSKNNILKRIIDCSQKYNFKYIFRLTGDNPYIDYKNYHKLKLLSYNYKHKEYFYSQLPLRGTRCELLKVESLQNLSRLLIDKTNVDYLTYFFFRKKLFKQKIIFSKKKYNISLTIDYKKNYYQIKSFFENKNIQNDLNSNKLMKIILKNKKLVRILKVKKINYIKLKTKKYDCRIIGDLKNSKIKALY
mgnify:CR=1 FL=1